MEYQLHSLRMILDDSYVTLTKNHNEVLVVVTRSSTLDFLHLEVATVKFLHVPQLREHFFMVVGQISRLYSY